jgi:protein O-GlcNAc transferase
VMGLADDELATAVRADGMDVLVDLAGHLGNSRLTAFAYKPAPVQASYVGYLNTTGLERVDWWIGDAVVTPPQAQRWYSERLYRLPRCFVCYTPHPQAPPVAPLPALRKGHVTFGCFANADKISPRAAGCWARILAALPGARLRLKSPAFADPAAAVRIAGWFAEQGLQTERVEFSVPTPYLAYLAEFSEIDIALDPFPCGGNTTTNDTLFMGVPVVSLAGETGVGRAGASLLTALGHPEWVAADESAYERIAQGLASDPQRLAVLRAGLRPEMEASPLLDGPGFARAMEGAFRDMWRQWCATQR